MAFQESEKLVVEIAEVLARNSDFKQRTLNECGVRFDALRERVSGLELKVEPIGTVWSSCKWVDVGYDKSHGADENAWCPTGAYLAKVDLEANNDSIHSPFVGRAFCCFP